MLEEDWDIKGSFPQGRNMNIVGLKAKQKVIPEFIASRKLFKIRVCRGDDADICFNDAVSAEG